MTAPRASQRRSPDSDLPSRARPVLATSLVHPRIFQDFRSHKLVASAALGQTRIVLSTFGPRLRAAVTSAVNRAKSALREATRPLPLVAGFALDLARSRRELLAENALLRQQLIVASRKVKRPAFRPHERGLVVLLSRLARRWRDALLLVKPDTILRWHRQGYRLLWRWKSRKPSKPRPRLSADVIKLIRCMAGSNATWGAERIRGELLKLGIRVAKRTIQRYMRAVRPPAPPRGQKWHSFLRNHTVWACDFLQTYDVWFRPIFAFFITDINAKKVVHVGVTRGPSERWTAQQLRNATPFGQGPQFTAPAALPRFARAVVPPGLRPAGLDSVHSGSSSGTGTTSSAPILTGSRRAPASRSSARPSRHL